MLSAIVEDTSKVYSGHEDLGMREVIPEKHEIDL